MRSRTLSPLHFTDREILSGELATGLPLRFAWLGLHTCADRAGRFRWDVPYLKARVLPHDDVDFEAVLLELCRRGALIRYEVRSADACGTRGDASRRVGPFSTFAEILGWSSTQVLNNRERASEIPAPNDPDCAVVEVPILHNATRSSTTDREENTEGQETGGFQLQPPSSPPRETPKANGRAAPRAPFQALVDVWNEEVAGSPLPACRAVSGQRLRDLTIALREEPDLEVWRAAIRELLAYPHACGQNDRGWKADIGFLVQPSQRSKWLEKGRAATGRRMVRTGASAPMNLVEEAFFDIDDRSRGTDAAFEAWLVRQGALPAGYPGKDPRQTAQLSPKQVQQAAAELRAWWKANVNGRVHP